MEHAQLNEDGSYSHQITTHGNVEWDSTHYCPASALTPEEAAHFRVVPLEIVPEPAYDPITTMCFRDGGELVGGAWRYKWTLVPLDAATVAANQAAAYAASIPASVSMRQARLALLDADLLATVNSTIAGMAGQAGEAARIEWEYATEVRRDSQLIAALAPAIGLTATQVDALFVSAGTR